MNEPTQAEKRAVLDNDRRVAAYSQVVDLYDDTKAHGRFAAAASKPVTEYPRQPEGSPWRSDVVGLEPPLGVAVDALEPVGEPHEIAASLGAPPVQQTPRCPSPLVSVADGGASPSIKRRC